MAVSKWQSAVVRMISPRVCDPMCLCLSFLVETAKRYKAEGILYMIPRSSPDISPRNIRMIIVIDFEAVKQQHEQSQGSHRLTVGCPSSTNAGLLQGEARTLGRRGGKERKSSSRAWARVPES